MSAPISVVIPTLNSADILPATLLSLMEGLEAGLICEVVVTDGGSTDVSGSIALDWGAEVITGAASRGGQLRRGVAVTRGAWIMVLHADTILQEGWAEQVKAHMQQGPLCFSLAFRARGLAARWVAAWANLRSDVLGLPFGDQGLLLRRVEYDRAGGYPDQPLMEDVALVRAIGAENPPTAGPCLHALPTSISSRAGCVGGRRIPRPLAAVFFGGRSRRLGASLSQNIEAQ